MIGRSYLKGLFHLIFPDLCYACRLNEPLREKHFCLPCEHQLPYIKSHEDARAALEGKEHFPANIPYFRSLFYYTKEGKVAEMIHRIKYQGQYRIAKYLGKQLAERLKSEGEWSDYVLIPVPVHRKRKKERGFNQSEEIAKGLSSELNIPVETSLLKRSQYEDSQTGKDKFNRSDVLQASFQIKDGLGQLPSKIILVDDVVTTGSTLGACVRVLRKRGASTIAVVSIGISI